MAKSKSRTGSEGESLAKELRSLIPKLDSEGLAFLVEQARIHLYNMQVVELNKAAQAAKTASLRKGALAKKTGQPKDDNFRIDGTASGSSYYLYYKNGSVMFSRDEMILLVKIVNAKATDLEIRERLFNWFVRERKDVFALFPMADKFDNQLMVLAKAIKKSFKLRP